jgi:hypothetical protein
LEWRFLKKLKIELADYITCLQIHLKEYKSGFYYDNCPPVFIVALFTIAMLWRQHKCPLMYEWIKKMHYRYTVKYYSTFKERNSCICDVRFNLEDIMLGEIRQIQKDKYCMISLRNKSIALKYSKRTIVNNIVLHIINL